jgi:hypothetical protein
MEIEIRFKGSIGDLGIYNVSLNEQGRRLYPSRTNKNNERTNLRIDQGGPVHGRPRTYKVLLQVNRETKNVACQQFIKKYGTHHVVATADVSERGSGS